eukprot:jgi/Mesen1/8438/ME000475S07713
MPPGGSGGSPAEAASHVLTALCELLEGSCYNLAGREEAGKTLLYLLTASLEPLLRMLDTWLHSGRVNDSAGEFFACPISAVSPEDSSFWLESHVLRRASSAETALRSGGGFSANEKQPSDEVAACPAFLQPLVADLMAAGKTRLLLDHDWQRSSPAGACWAPPVSETAGNLPFLLSSRDQPPLEAEAESGCCDGNGEEEQDLQRDVPEGSAAQ